MKEEMSTYQCPDCNSYKQDRANKFVVCKGGIKRGHRHTVKMVEVQKGIVKK